MDMDMLQGLTVEVGSGLSGGGEGGKLRQL